MNFSVRPLPQGDAPLEPSLQNEVDHAISLGEQWLAGGVVTNVPFSVGEVALFATGSLTRADIAVKFISSQRGEGWWVTSTNTAPTRLAIEILKGL